MRKLSKFELCEIRSTPRIRGDRWPSPATATCNSAHLQFCPDSFGTLHAVARMTTGSISVVEEFDDAVAVGGMVTRCDIFFQIYGEVPTVDRPPR